VTPVYEHIPENHLSFQNADGTRSRICLCLCSNCWPVDGTDGPCPVWNGDSNREV
jgi:hypothetical protein